MKKSDSSKRHGYTLTELAIVLGITGLLIGGIWQAASFVYFNVKLNRNTQQLATIVNNIRALYAMGGDMKQPNFTDITTNLVSADVFPSDVPIIGGRPYNVFGGQFKVESQGNCGGPFSIGSCDATTFEVEIFPLINSGGTIVGQNPCAAILTRLLGSGRDPGLVAVFDNSNGWRDPATVRPNTIDPNCSYTSLVYKLRIDQSN